jgi:hypothetical protein
VNVQDFNLLASHYGQSAGFGGLTSVIPEPSILSLAAATTLMLRRRSRR